MYHQVLSDVLKHELWLSVTSAVEFNVQTLWYYIKAEGSDAASFALKMETRLKSLCLYHADLYSDSRFNELGSRLISDAKSIRKRIQANRFTEITASFSPHSIRLVFDSRSVELCRIVVSLDHCV